MPLESEVEATCQLGVVVVVLVVLHRVEHILKGDKALKAGCVIRSKARIETSQSSRCKPRAESSLDTRFRTLVRSHFAIRS